MKKIATKRYSCSYPLYWLSQWRDNLPASGLRPMLIFDKAYLEYVRSVLRQSMHAPHVPTTQSWIYRKRASEVARQADASSDTEEQVNLVKLALQWLQLAENEEFMALHHQRANDN